MRAMLNQRNVDVTGKRKEEAFYRTSCVYNNHFALLSMTAYSYFLDTADMVEETPLYRGKTKQMLNRCKRWVDTYWRRVKTTFGDRYALYVDYSAQCAEGVEGDVTRFFFAIKNALDRKRVKDSHLKARVLVAAELIRVTAFFHHDFWTVAERETGMRGLGRQFDYANPAPLLSMYTGFAGTICNQEEADVLNDDQSIRIGLRAILNKAEGSEVMGEAAHKALLFNAEVNEEYRRRLEEFEREKEEC